MGDAADNYFVDTLNFSRHGTGMQIIQGRVLDPRVLTKYAVLVVMSKNVWLRSSDILHLLEALSYHRVKSTIRQGLSRIVKFGFAEEQKTPLDRHGRKEWKLTEHGFQFVQSPGAEAKARGPVKTPKAPKQKKLRAPKQKNVVPQQIAPSGAPGGTTMCIDLSKPTLNSAIETTVSLLMTEKQKFSAHDVTKRMRQELVKDDAKGGALGIDPRETGEVYVQGQMVPNIDHDYVRDAVHELFHLGKMTGYARHHNGSFWEYEEQAIPKVVADPASSDHAETASPADPAPAASSDSSYDGTPTL